MLWASICIPQGLVTNNEKVMTGFNEAENYL